MPSLSTGSRLGPYEILSPISAGGMGEVYKASDARLNRTVAIKVLPPNWADDPDRRARFEREAKVLAGLNHPNICTVFEVGRETPVSIPPADSAQAPSTDTDAEQASSPRGEAPEAVDFLVMEYLEGETVSERLARAVASKKSTSAFRVDEVLTLAIEIADGVDKAHAQGVVHRDLKPSNVLLVKNGERPSGPPVAKLLDFGLANLKTLTGASTIAAVTMADAGSAAASAASVQYMTPEQLEGKETDPRTDIFAFGVLVYEMLTGRKAFEGKNRAVMTAAIMTSEPDPLLALQPMTPPALDHAIKRCLAKDPDERWQTVHDLLIRLRWIAGTGAGAGLSGALAAQRRKQQRVVRLALAVAAILVVALAVPAALYLRGPGETETFQFRVPLVGLINEHIALSPDGRSIAAVARPNQGEPSSLFVRPVGSISSRKLAGTDDATQPFWSPDSRFIAFVAGGKLKKVEAAGGPPQLISDAADFSGGTWSREGTVLFGSSKGLFRVSAEGGKPAPITTVEQAQLGHFWPHFLPDGRHYLYLAWSAQSTSRALFAGTLDSKETKRLMPAESNVAFAAPGYLLFHRESTLFAQPFDAKNVAFTGEPVHVADGVSFNPASGRGDFDVSQAETLIYFQGAGGVGVQTGRAGIATPNLQFGWVSRTGQQLAPVGEQGSLADMDLSPDEKLVAVTRQEAGAPGADIWIIDWQRAGVATRLTLDPGDNINPVWSPDGARVAFTSYRKGNADIYVKNANGVGPETPLLESPGNESIEAWSRDGRYIAYVFGQDNLQDIYVLPLFGDKKPFPVVQGRFQKNEPQFSYDGKWLAYTSNESGTFQVYVMSFPSGGEKLQISTDGGGQPRWRQDGRELYYRALDNRVMAVDIKPEPRLESSVPRVLFNPANNNTINRDPIRHQLAVSPDGQRFLLRVPAGVAGARAGGTPQAPTAFFPATGRSGGAQGFAIGGAGIGGGVFANGAGGFTVVRNWTSALRDAGKK